jgi:crotonobetainyl-CoA:carnitine CoA-transferase CaiB-like acyl-CoA transferase
MLQSERFWSRFCQAIDRPELEKDPRFISHQAREENSLDLIAIISEAIATRTLAEWQERLRRYDLVGSKVQTASEVIQDPQAWENQFFTEIDHPIGGRLKIINSPVKFRQNPASVKSPAPELGQHTEEILLELGYSWEDIGEFKRQEVII